MTRAPTNLLTGPHAPTHATLAEVNAVKTLFAENNAGLKWIIKATGLGDLPWYPGGEDGRRNTDFAAGKYRVGTEIKRLIEMPEAKLKELAEQEAKERNGG